MFEQATLRIANVLASELTEALIVAVIYGLVLSDLRKYLKIEKLFEFLHLKNIGLKIIIFLIYYILLIGLGLFGLILVLFMMEVLF